MSSTKSKMLKGMFWITIDKYSGLLLSILVSMILARLLSPAEFGLLALASVILSFIGIISGMGLGPAIIQEKDLQQKDINSVFTFSVIVGFLLSFLFFCLSWPIASFYENKQLVPVCQLLALNFFLGVINGIPSTLMVKNQRFKEMAICSFSLNLLAAPISIFAAYKGLGVYSLMIAPFISSILGIIYVRHFYKCNIDFHMSMAPIKRMASFSLYQLAFELVNYFFRNLDKLIIGRWMSIRDLGYYDKSYRLMQQPQNNITAVLNPVLQPNFAQYQNDMSMMATQYLKVISVMAAISFPLGITLCMCGPEIIRFMYGPQWELAIPCFQILCLSLPCAMLTSTTGSIFQASNATKCLFFVGCVNSAAVVIGFLIASYYFRTIEAVALAFTLYSVIGLLFTFSVMFHHVLKSNILVFLRTLIKPLGNCIIVASILYLLNCYVEIPLIPSLILKLSSAMVVTLAYMQITGVFDVISKGKALINRLRKKNEV